MSSTLPYLPPVLSTVDEILTTGKIPALNGDEMEVLCSHLFALRDRDQQMRIAEIAYYNYNDSQALNLFLSCTIPIAQRMTQRKAERVFTHPTDWQLEAMYGGAVSFLLEMFEAHRPLQPLANSFRRYLVTVIFHGAMNPLRIRQEHWGIRGVEDITKFERLPMRCHNAGERQIITHDLLGQITTFPHLMEDQARLLKTIAALGPEKGLRDKDPRSDDQLDRRNFRSLLDLTQIANAMGMKKTRVKYLLRDTRKILRDVFNRDGTLFAG